jgi:alkaline phosphatase D
MTSFGPVPRRTFLAGMLAVAACSGDDGSATPATTTTSTAPTATTEPLPIGPFRLGVASGDPGPDGFAIWTRLLDADGDVAVRWQVGERTGTATAVAADAHSLHITVDGLEPDRWYDYRFVIDGQAASVTGRARTTPAAGTDVPLRLAHASCQRRADGLWMAWDDVAASEVDLVAFCGDFIYEEAPFDLDGYRRVWTEYRSDPTLQAASAAAPWLIAWDDHEVFDDYREADGERRSAAYQAWWEHTPTRLPRPGGADHSINREVRWGDLARFLVLDSRSRRDETCPSDRLGPRCDEADSYSMLGAPQEAWLADRLREPAAVWDVLVQQVVMAQWRALPGNQAWNLDQWDGYPGARRRLLEQLVAHAGHPIVLSGDVHASAVHDLRVDPDDEDAPVVGSEFVAPGISSLPPDSLGTILLAVRAQSPHVLDTDVRHRGWVRHDITADAWQATFRWVDDATVEGSPIDDGFTFRVPADHPGAEEA